MAEVHSTAIVEAGAELDTEVSVGPYAIIGANVRVGARTCVGSHTILEGWSEIGPDCQIGSHVIIGACSAALQDIPSYVKVQGNRAKPFGLNVVGLRRHGVSREALQALKEAYRLFFESELNTSQALEQVTIGGGALTEVQRFIEFIQRSRRGISK